MKNSRIIQWVLLCMIAGGFTACGKDYIVGGEIEDVDQYKNMSTYDVLAADPLYDTLVQLIDAAGLKDQINASGTTFFAPTDYSIYSYLNQRTIQVQNVDEYAKFALDSLLYYIENNVDNTRDSLLLYLVPANLSYDAMSAIGQKYETALAGDTVVVSYEYTQNTQLGYSELVSGTPQVVYFTQLWQPYDISEDTPAGDIPEETGIRTLCKISGLTTQNGVLNTLEVSHTLFFYGTQQ